MAWKSTGFVETLDTFFSMAFINRTGATLLLTVLFLCLWHFPRRRVHSFRHPVNTVFAKFIVIGATLLSFIRHPHWVVYAVACGVVVFFLYRLPTRLRAQLYVWIIDVPVFHALRVLFRVAYISRSVWWELLQILRALCEAWPLTVAGLPFYFVGKIYYESIVFPFFAVIHEPAVAMFAMATFITWRLLSSRFGWYLQRLRVRMWEEAIFVILRIVWLFVKPTVMAVRNIYSSAQSSMTNR